MRYRENKLIKSGYGVPAFLGAALIAFTLLAFGAPSALAVQTHAFTDVTIGPGGKAAAGQFTDLASVAVDSAGNLYVLDTANNGRLYKFDSAGEPLYFTGTGTNFIEGTGGFQGQTDIINQVAIAPPGALAGTGNDIYIANSQVVKIYSPAGVEIGQLTLPSHDFCGVAVDAAGNVFAKNTEPQSNPIVRKYTPTANPPTNADESSRSTVQMPGTCNLAVDSEGRVYAAGISGTPTVAGPSRGLRRLESLTAETSQLFDPESSAVAVEPVTDDVYVSHGIEVLQYAEDGSLLAKFGEGRLAEAPGLAIAKADGNVYVASRTRQNEPFQFSGRVDVFGPLAALPKAAAGTTDQIGKTNAVLHGTIDAEGGPEASCEFEYTPQAAFNRLNEVQGLTVAATGGTFTLGFVNPPGGTAQTTAPIAFDAERGAVQAALAALPNIGAGNVHVTEGSDGHGTLAPYAITFVGALSAQNLEQIAVNPGGLTGGGSPTAEVQTLTDGQTGGFAGAPSAPCAPDGPFTGSAAEAVSASISGLSAGTEYRYRLVGENENGRLGSDEDGTEPKGPPSFETLGPFAAVTGPVTDLTETSATLTGSINPEGVTVSECFFEYGKTSAYGMKLPCESPGAGEIGNGNGSVPVHADVTGLTAGTEYHFRLLGGSSEFPGAFARGADVPFGTPALPQVVSQSFSSVGQTSATISGSINPHSSSTTYFVEYVTQSAFEEGGYATAAKIPLAGAPIGSGFAAVELGQQLSGLIPASKYHFRLFAENGVGHSEGPDGVFTTKVAGQLFRPCPANEAFRVDRSALLPDCRAYEQASSPDKNGGAVAGLYTQMFAAEDGSGVTFYSPVFALPPGQRGGTQNYSTYLSSRAAASWSSQRLLPPQQFGERAEFLGSTPDLRYAIVEAGFVERGIAKAGLFEIDTENGAVGAVLPYQPFDSHSFYPFGLDGVTADGSRIFFESGIAIPTTPPAPSATPGHVNLYVWERATGDVSLVGVLPAGEGGAAPVAGSFGGAYEWFEGEVTSTGGALSRGQSIEPLEVAALHAISPNGEQVFFTAAGTGRLYLRRGIGSPEPTTIRVSSPNRGVSSPERPAAFQEATPDGTRAFFMSQQKLTASATTGTQENGRDLYRWDASAAAGKSLTDIAPDPGDPNGAEVQGLLGVASDGSSGYFVAHGVLGDAKAKGIQEAGGENLYRFSEEAAGSFRITFIATLAEGNGTPDRRNVSPKVFFNADLGKTSRLSENGETLLFTSARPLTGYDNFNLEGISCGGGSCPELYLYSAGTEALSCVSCDPTGEAPLGAASLQDPLFNAYFTPITPPAGMPSRNFSADGTRVFFQTPDPLITADENGKEGCPASAGRPGAHNFGGPGLCQDVYEWEAVGSGSCKAAEANGGCLYLLSTGQSEQPSYFVGASKDGSNAFIATTSRLVPADRDQADDVYDVREGGGLASQYVIAQPPCASAEACKGAAGSPAPVTSPATPSFQGSGNQKATSCKKGFVHKGGKCVKSKHHKKKHHKKKHHKKKHHKKKRAAGTKHSGGAK